MDAILGIDETTKQLIPKRSATIVNAKSESVTNDDDHEHHHEGCSGIQKHAITLLISIGKGQEEIT